MKKIIKPLVFLFISAFSLSGCNNNNSAFDFSKPIVVVSREDGSGTRGTFVELFNIILKGNNGTRKDLLTKEAIITKQTDVMMTNISSNQYAIGYSSLGSLNQTIKALKIDNIEPNTENIKNGSYTISRSFNIATKGEPTGSTKDFIDFILSVDGQNIISENYTPIIDNPKEYTSANSKGKIVIAGSSSVAPIMENLKEAYIAINPNVKIEIQQSDSSSGIASAIAGTCNIGMSSRNLDEKELSSLKPIPIALDGIIVIVNKNNPIENLSKEQVKSIFTGEFVKWSEL